ncbi:uncharacterized protein LOC126880634 [Diabrotica virgifera virgifera]|uniref:Uncharacterized protein n=1 Tax=Diabrotica virgifera virgifera TaxID=50390 RepID=A0ABM5JRP2_DIAVI|nr:uncharacterized protein LOC126880634 [Diabrotica virgifera virgifera]XP_050500611.1 uncharacterized protein LOC126880634 [Diabrotica virgifera virgifera]
MSERKRFLTPPIRKISAHKNNETVLSTTMCPEGPSYPASTSGVKSQVVEAECDLLYNDYLQSLLKYEIITKQIKEQKNVLNGQILFQEDNVSKRKEQLMKIQDDTEHLLLKEEIVKMIKQLEENIIKLGQIYENYQIQNNIEIIHANLQKKSSTLVLKNIHPIETELQYNSFIDSLTKLTSACEKIVNSGRDFDGINNLAQQCKNLSQNGNKIKELQDMFSTLQVHVITSLFQQLSDIFATQYDNVEQKI